MDYQSNPYLIWQLIPTIVTLGLALYVESRPKKKRESKAFSLLMFGGAIWSFANAVQWYSPDMEWQQRWNLVLYIGIVLIPTAWFVFAVNFTGIGYEQINKRSIWFWFFPVLTYIAVLSNEYHQLFYTSQKMQTIGEFVSLTSEYGPLFFVHTIYSYILLMAGLIIIGRSLFADFSRYGSHVYGLILGVLAPFIGNAYYIFGPVPPGFPDPTPIAFTITGLSFSWVIFSGKMLEVVPIAHDSVIQKLSNGILVLDLNHIILDINLAATKIFGKSRKLMIGGFLPELIKDLPELLDVIISGLVGSTEDDVIVEFTPSDQGSSFSMNFSQVRDSSGKITGQLVQIVDVSDRIRAEEDLAITRSDYEETLDTLLDSYFEADPDGNLTFANKALVKSLGQSDVQDVVGKNFRHFIHRNSIREVFENFQKLYETRKPIKSFEYFYSGADGVERIAEIAVSPIIKGTEIIGARGIIRDVTAKKKAETEIQEQKDLLDGLLQQSPIAIVLNDLERKITVVNPEFEKLFGYSQDEAIGKNLDDILSIPEIVKEMRSVSRKSLNEELDIYSEGKRKRKDGSLLDIELFSTPYYVGDQQYGYMVFYNDISERIKAKAELKQTQETFSEILDTLEDPYFEADNNGKITFVNKAYWKNLRYLSKEDIIGKNFRHFTDRKSVRLVFERFQTLFKTKKPIKPFVYQYRKIDGTVQSAEISVSPVFVDGEVVGSRGIIRDYDERKKVEEVLKKAKEAAEFRAGELATINRISDSVSRSLNLNEILQSVCEELTAIFEIRNAGVGLLNKKQMGLKIIAFHSIDSEEESPLGKVMPLEKNSSIKEVLKSKKTIVIQNTNKDQSTESSKKLSDDSGTAALMVVPLLARGEAIGTIGMPAKNPNHEFTDNEIELAETIASQIATAVENARLHAQTETALDVAERDLEIGRQIQSGFFPEFLPEIPGWEITTHFQAARQVAGDFYDIFQLKNSNLTAFIIADVCDKGVGAALFMVLFRSLLRAFSEREIEIDNLQDDLLEIIVNTNKFISEIHGKSNMFATVFAGILDPDTGKLTYVNGGHDSPIILDKTGIVIHTLTPTGPAVGLFPDLEFSVKEIQLNKGDILFGFTDGTIDARDQSGKIFTEERLLQSVSSPWSSSFSMVYDLNSSVQKHIGDQDQYDDITQISLRRQITADPKVHTFTRKADIEHLGEFRDFAEAAAINYGLNHEHAFAFKLATEEICNNILQNGYQGQAPGEINLSFKCENKKAILAITDDGKYFSPDQAGKPDIEADWSERRIGGLGIYFVNELMDKVSYNKIGDGKNLLVLEKELK